MQNSFISGIYDALVAYHIIDYLLEEVRCCVVLRFWQLCVGIDIFSLRYYVFNLDRTKLITANCLLLAFCAELRLSNFALFIVLHVRRTKKL